MFARASPRIMAKVVMISKYRIVLKPNLPTCFPFPAPATPMIKLETTIGITIILIKRKEIPDWLQVSRQCWVAIPNDANNDT